MRLGTLEPLLAVDRYVVSGTIAGEIFVFDAFTRKLVTSSIPVHSKIRGFCELPNTGNIAAAINNGSFMILKLPTLEVLQTEKHHRLSVEAVAYDSARRWLFAGSEDGTISIWRRSAEDPEESQENFEHFFTIDLELGPVRRLLYLDRVDSLAVVIEGETAVRQIQLPVILARLSDLGLVDQSDSGSACD
jgi:WD40 repeat protein